MKDWIKQRIQGLADQLKDPECGHPARVEAKKEAFEEMLYMIEKEALHIADVIKPKGTVCEHPDYEIITDQDGHTYCGRCWQDAE